MWLGRVRCIHPHVRGHLAPFGFCALLFGEYLLKVHRQEAQGGFKSRHRPSAPLDWLHAFLLASRASFQARLPRFHSMYAVRPGRSCGGGCPQGVRVVDAPHRQSQRPRDRRGNHSLLLAWGGRMLDRRSCQSFVRGERCSRPGNGLPLQRSHFRQFACAEL